MKQLFILLSLLILISTNAAAEETPHYYWGLATLHGQSGVFFDTEMYVGKKEFKGNTMIETKWAKSPKYGKNMTEFHFDFDLKTLVVKQEGKIVGKGTFTYEGTKESLNQIKYQYETEGEDAFTYSGIDTYNPTGGALYKEVGDWRIAKERFLFEIDYYPIEAKFFREMTKLMQ